MSSENGANGAGVTSAKEWRRDREEGIEVALPSGKVPRIRPYGMDLLVKAGYTPDILEGYVVQMIETGKGELPKDATLEDETKWFKFLDDLCMGVFVSPRVVKSAEDITSDDQICVDDIELSDKMEIWRVLGAPARLLVDYFRQAREPVGPVAATEVHVSGSLGDPGREGVGQPDAGHGGSPDRVDGGPGGADVRRVGRKPAEGNR